VDFFVRSMRASDTAQNAANLNTKFIREPQFTPDRTTPLNEAWHRVDGLNRGWVLFQWDDALFEHIAPQRTVIPGFPAPDLDIRPPQWRELPADWQALMEIRDPAKGIGVLGDGIDAYGADRDAATQAVREVLNRGSTLR
jgi:hypothetical protein